MYLFQYTNKLIISSWHWWLHLITTVMSIIIFCYIISRPRRKFHTLCCNRILFIDLFYYNQYCLNQLKGVNLLTTLIIFYLSSNLQYSFHNNLIKITLNNDCLWWESNQRFWLLHLKTSMFILIFFILLQRNNITFNYNVKCSLFYFVRLSKFYNPVKTGTHT